MNLIDSSVWMRYLSHGEFSEYILKDHCISVMCLAEISDVMLRRNLPTSKVINHIKSRCLLYAVDDKSAVDGAKLKNLYRKKKNKFSLVDGIHLATARNHQCTFVTRDRDFEGIKGVKVV